VQAGPRVLYGDQAAVTTAGVHAQAEELKTQVKKAAQALMLVAVLTTLGAVLFGFLVFSITPRPGQVMLITPVDVVISGVVAAIFWGLYFWARRNPLPAAIVGLVLYVTLTVVQFVTLAVVMSDLREQEVQEAREQGLPPPESKPGNPLGGGMCGIFIRVFIVMMLIQGITAGVKHRKLLKQQRQAGFPPPASPPGAWPPGPPPMPPTA
jgi:hypothetical protein